MASAIIKKAVKPLYYFVHDSLFKSIDYNPFFRQKQNGKKIGKGHVSAEHLQNPELDDQLVLDLKKSDIEVANFHISKDGYVQYMKSANYPDSYYGGGKDKNQNFTEKTLEHYVSTEFINFHSEAVHIDIAACNSPFHQILKDQFELKKTFQQDLVYPKGVDGSRIGGYAHEIPLDDNSVDSATLHCSLEHFEGNSDTLFFKTMGRVLKPGGRIIVLPFYIANEYTIHVDPVYNLLKGHKPEIDPKAELRYCDWYQYFSRHYNVKALKDRILNQVPELNLKIYRVQNFKEVHEGSYLRFIGVFEKKPLG